MNPADRVGLEMLLARAKRFQRGSWRASDRVADRIDALVPVLQAHVDALNEGGSWRELVRRNATGARLAANVIDEVEFIVDTATEHFGDYEELPHGLPDQGAGVQGEYKHPTRGATTRAQQRTNVRRQQIWDRIQEADTLESQGDKKGARRIREELGLEEPEPRDDASDAVVMRLNAGESNDEVLAAFGALSREQQYVVRQRLNPEGEQAWDAMSRRDLVPNEEGGPHGEIPE